MYIRKRMIQYETQAQNEGLRFVFGVDEAGCGPLAGPVVAAAVLLKGFAFKIKINDSKQMTPDAREAAFHEILEKAYVGIGIMSEVVIDQINILNAAQHAMETAVRHLWRSLPGEIKEHKDFDHQVILLVDGNRYRCQLPYRYQTIVDGDAKSLSIACASIVAKVSRDRIMNHYNRLYPEYGFDKHKGYGTKAHRLAIEQYGPSKIQRRSFSIKEYAIEELSEATL